MSVLDSIESSKLPGNTATSDEERASLDTANEHGSGGMVTVAAEKCVEGNMSASLLRVEGCSHASSKDLIEGIYHPFMTNHGRTMWKRASGGHGAAQTLIHYWDERDGNSQHGWWFGDKPGAEEAWAHHLNTNAVDPPEDGWNVPCDGPIDLGFRIFRIPPGAFGDPVQIHPQGTVPMPSEITQRLEPPASWTSSGSAVMTKLATGSDAEKAMKDVSSASICTNVESKLAVSTDLFPDAQQHRAHERYTSKELEKSQNGSQAGKCSLVFKHIETNRTRKTELLEIIWALKEDNQEDVKVMEDIHHRLLLHRQLINDFSKESKATDQNTSVEGIPPPHSLGDRGVYAGRKTKSSRDTYTKKRKLDQQCATEDDESVDAHALLAPKKIMTAIAGRKPLSGDDEEVSVVVQTAAEEASKGSSKEISKLGKAETSEERTRKENTRKHKFKVVPEEACKGERALELFNQCSIKFTINNVSKKAAVATSGFLDDDSDHVTTNQGSTNQVDIADECEVLELLKKRELYNRCHIDSEDDVKQNSMKQSSKVHGVWSGEASDEPIRHNKKGDLKEHRLLSSSGRNRNTRKKKSKSSSLSRSIKRDRSCQQDGHDEVICELNVRKVGSEAMKDGSQRQKKRQDDRLDKESEQVRKADQRRQRSLSLKCSKSRCSRKYRYNTDSDEDRKNKSRHASSKARSDSSKCVRRRVRETSSSSSPMNWREAMSRRSVLTKQSEDSHQMVEEKSHKTAEVIHTHEELKRQKEQERRLHEEELQRKRAARRQMEEAVKGKQEQSSSASLPLKDRCAQVHGVLTGLEPKVVEVESMVHSLANQISACPADEQVHSSVMVDAINAIAAAASELTKSLQAVGTLRAEAPSDESQDVTQELTKLGDDADCLRQRLSKAEELLAVSRRAQALNDMAAREANRMEVAEEFRALVEAHGTMVDRVFSLVDQENCGFISTSQLAPFLGNLDDPAGLIGRLLDTSSGVGRQAATEQDQQLSRDQFSYLIRVYYKVLTQTAMSDILATEGGNQLRDFEVGEIVQVVEGPRLDESSSILRVRVSALNDGLTGWATITGTQNLMFLLRGGTAMKVLKPIQLGDEQGDTVVAESTSALRLLIEGEAVELLSWFKPDGGLTRVRICCQEDSVCGWVPLRDANGDACLEAA